jgi:hypothetical protein
MNTSSGESKACPPDAPKQSTFTTKVGLAKMLKGGVIMDVVNADQVSAKWRLILYSASHANFPRLELPRRPVLWP